jgi:hypothetical protein
MATVFDIGTINNATTATFSVTIPSAVPIGAVVVVATRENTVTSSAGMALTDTRGNAYTVRASQLGGASTASAPCMFWDSAITTALASGDTITFTKGGAATDSAIMTAGYITGLATSPFDSAVLATNHSATTTATITSGAPSVPGEVFMAVSLFGNTIVSSGDPTWTTPPFANNNGLSSAVSAGALGGYRINPGTGTLTWTAVSTLALNWGTIIVGYKPFAAFPSVSTEMPRWRRSALSY